jgi:CheY-like chemotaxis protein
LTKKTIFVVEDDGIVALSSYELLTKSGYDVPRMFASGEELLDHLEQEGQPDLILMDIGLDGKIDGIETARRVRQRYNVPVIFVSSYADDEKKARAQEIPAQGYIVKPVIEHQLMEMISEVLWRGCCG